MSDQPANTSENAADGDKNEASSAGRHLAVSSPVIESASATTSPDNANSGNVAYILTAGAILLAIGLCMGLWNCTSSIVEAAVRSHGAEIVEQFENSLGDGSDGSEYGYRSNGSSGDDGSSSRGGSTGSSLSVDDAIDLNLDLYSNNIGANISASDYAGTPEAMRSFVLSVVHTDQSHNSQVIADLNAASAADDPREEVEAAIAECDAAQQELNAVQDPAGLSDEVTSQAQDARTKAVARWQALASELQLLDTQDEVSYADLANADQSVATATSDAASSLVQALTLAAQSR